MARYSIGLTLCLCIACSAGHYPEPEEESSSTGGTTSQDAEGCSVTWTDECVGVRYGTEECSLTSSVMFEDGVEFACSDDPDGKDCSGAWEAARHRCESMEGDPGGDGDAGESGGSGGSLGPHTGGSENSSGGAYGSGGSGGEASGGTVSTGGVTSSGGSVSTGGSCATKTYCNDVDRDGFVDMGDCVSSCTPPGPPYTYHNLEVAHGTDCYDGNVNARPSLEERQHFAAERGDGSWDYDCDGVEESEYQVGSCLKVGSADKKGWVGSVPACGETGDFVEFDIDDNCFFTTAQVRCR